MASQPPVLALRQWNCSRSWGQLKRWSRHTHRCCPPRDQDLPGHFPWVKSCVNVPNLRRNVRLVSFITVDGWEKEEEEEERAAPTTRRQLERLHLVFRNTLLMCLAAFPQFPQFNLTKEDLDSFYDWFYGPELGAVGLPLRSRRCSWQREVHESMHGGMYLKEALDKVQNNSLFWMREVYERVISERAKGKSKKGKDKKGSWGYPIRQPLWEKKGKGHGDKGGKGKGKGKSRPSDWPSNWAFKNPKGVTSSRRPAKASVDVLTIVQRWTRKAGSAMQDPKSTSQRIALTRLEGIGRADGAVEHPGNQEGGNVIQGDIGAEGTRFASTTVGGGDAADTGGAPDLPRTSSPHAPNLALRMGADGAVAPRREGVHSFETGGSPAFPRTWGPNDSNLTLGTAANGAETPRKTGVHSKRVRPAASQSGKSAKHSNLTGRGLGQGISFQNQMSSGSELKPIPGWDTFQIDWGKGFYLQWPKGPSTQDQYWCFSMLGRMIHFPWTVVFTLIIHGCRHM